MAGSSVTRKATLDEIRNMGVTDYNFLSYSAGDVVKSAALNADADAGLWSLAKYGAATVGTLVSPAIGGLAFLGMSAFHDAYQIQRASGNDSNKFWTDYFQNLDEAKKEDGFFRDFIESVNVNSSMFASTAEGLPTSKGLGYNVGSLLGILSRDVAAYAAGGTSLMIGAMSVNEALDTGAYRVAMDDDITHAIWPAIVAGGATGITGHLFMNKIGPVIRDFIPKVASGTLGTAMQTVATGGEFAGWTASDHILESVGNFDPSLPAVSELGPSFLIGMAFGAAGRGLEAWAKRAGKEAPKPTAEGKPAEWVEPEPAVKTITDPALDATTKTDAILANDMATGHPLTEQQAAQVANQVVREAVKEPGLDLGEVLAKTVEASGDGRFTLRNIEQVMPYAQSLMPNANLAGAIPAYLRTKESLLFKPFTVTKGDVKGMVSIEQKQPLDFMRETAASLPKGQGDAYLKGATEALSEGRSVYAADKRGRIHAGVVQKREFLGEAPQEIVFPKEPYLNDFPMRQDIKNVYEEEYAKILEKSKNEEYSSKKARKSARDRIAKEAYRDAAEKEKTLAIYDATMAMEDARGNYSRSIDTIINAPDSDMTPDKVQEAISRFDERHRKVLDDYHKRLGGTGGWRQ